MPQAVGTVNHDFWMFPKEPTQPPLTVEVYLRAPAKGGAYTIRDYSINGRRLFEGLRRGGQPKGGGDDSTTTDPIGTWIPADEIFDCGQGDFVFQPSKDGGFVVADPNGTSTWRPRAMPTTFVTADVATALRDAAEGISVYRPIDAT